jgi:hypothetical protein
MRPPIEVLALLGEVQFAQAQPTGNELYSWCRLRLLRGGAGTSLGGASPHPRRGPAHRRQHRQAAGALPPWVMRVIANLHCRSRLDGFPSLASTNVRLAGAFSVRRDAGLSPKDFVNPRRASMSRRGDGLRPHAGGPGIPSQPSTAGVSSSLRLRRA